MDIDTDRLLGAWENAVRERPVDAWRIGPPNWLVLEDWRGEKVESFLEAAERVKARYFPDGRPGVNALVNTAPVNTSVNTDRTEYMRDYMRRRRDRRNA